MSSDVRNFGNTSLYPSHKLPDGFESREVLVDLAFIMTIGEHGYDTAEAIFDQAAVILAPDYKLKGKDYCLCVDSGPAYGSCAAYQTADGRCEIVVALPPWADGRPKRAADVYTCGDLTIDDIQRVVDALLDAHLYVTMKEARHPRPAC